MRKVIKVCDVGDISDEYDYRIEFTTQKEQLQQLQPKDSTVVFATMNEGINE